MLRCQCLKCKVQIYYHIQKCNVWSYRGTCFDGCNALVTLPKNRAEPGRRVEILEKFWQSGEGGKRQVVQGHPLATPMQFLRWWEPAGQIYANEGKISGRSGRSGIHVARNSSLPRQDIFTRSSWAKGEPRVGHRCATCGPRVGYPCPPHGKRLVKNDAQAWPMSKGPTRIPISLIDIIVTCPWQKKGSFFLGLQIIIIIINFSSFAKLFIFNWLG